MNRYANTPRGSAHHNSKGGAHNYAINTETGCWDFQGEIRHNGYGCVYRMTNGKRTTIVAHKALYQELVGPIPEGLELDHLCRNRRCVNPEHLEPVTTRENARRGIATKLTVDQVAAIKALRGIMPASAIPEFLGLPVKHWTVLDIWSGRSWTDVEPAVWV